MTFDGDDDDGPSSDMIAMVRRDALLSQMIVTMRHEFPEEIAAIIVAHPVDEKIIQVVGAGSQSKQQMTMLIDRLIKLRDQMSDHDEEETDW